MSILFISDLYLEVERSDITRAFLPFPDECARWVEALYIPSDFFKAWANDDDVDVSQHSTAQSLYQMTDDGIRIYLMHGNRDFLIGKALCREAGRTLLLDPSVIDLYGEPVPLVHGDGLCTRDGTYTRLRRWLHNPFTLWVLRYLPLATRYKLARRLHRESHAQTRMKAVDIIDITPEGMPRVMRRYGVCTLIHGHTYRPAKHPLDIDGQPTRHIVLGDRGRQD